MAQPEELDTLAAQQETVRKHAYRIRNYLYEMSDEAKADPGVIPAEKIQQMIVYEMGTANILADVLATLPKLGKGK